MLLYQLRLALKSIRRNPVLSTVMVLGIALGIAVSMSFVSAYYIISGDPIPHKSDKLFYVQLDSWNPDNPFSDDDPTEPPNQLTYMDAMALMESDIPTHHTAMHKTVMVVHPPNDSVQPTRHQIRMCFSDFFALFDVAFDFGGPWDAAADKGPEPVIVLSAETNEELFGGENSVGRSLRVEDQEFKVVGVLAPWHPTPKFYDPHNGAFDSVEPVFMPLHWAREMQIVNAGNTSGWKPYDNSYEGKLRSEAVWLQFWAQLDTEEQKERYAQFLTGYAEEQRAGGRFQRPNNHRLRDVNAWLEYWGVVDPSQRAMVIIALLFLLVCAVNLIGILLGKFLSRASEVGVRRALGASRMWIFSLHLVECAVIGIAGSVIGLLLSLAGISYIQRLFGVRLENPLDLTMLSVGIGLSLLAALVAGIYPAWRICRIAPGMHLKTQ